MTVIEKSSGEELAKVLWYYNMIPDVRSSNQKIVCPFHGDVNPSMLINLDEGSWFCFGCGRAGNAIKFVKEMEIRNGLNDLQAYKKYMTILKSDKCSGITRDIARKLQKPPRRDLYNQAYDYYHGLAKVDWMSSGESEVIQAKEYMMNRGFDSITLSKCKAKVTYNRSYGLIFPMLDNGKFKGWVCRTMIKTIEQKRKYLYNEGFSRATTLVGDYGFKSYVIVVEGYMDRLKFVQFGEDSVVAILGWKMSQQQIDKINKQKNIKYVISALDNDKCGKKGSDYLSRVFGSKYLRFSYLKGIKDPGEMNKGSFDRMFKRTMKKIQK